jgi:hypothetical protein
MLIVREHPDFLGPHPQPLADNESDVGEQLKGALRKDPALELEYPDLAVLLETAALVGVSDSFEGKNLEACREKLRNPSMKWSSPTGNSKRKFQLTAI